MSEGPRDKRDSTPTAFLMVKKNTIHKTTRVKSLLDIRPSITLSGLHDSNRRLSSISELTSCLGLLQPYSIPEDSGHSNVTNLWMSPPLQKSWIWSLLSRNAPTEIPLLLLLLLYRVHRAQLIGSIIRTGDRNCRSDQKSVLQEAVVGPFSAHQIQEYIKQFKKQRAISRLSISFLD
ncbi:MAG: hypothetical protein J3Q66DRAFT_329907 [Benniella sp.]|nr:MAG: hypothetical protein J3Q66DRAFT_329907 [Benniella sp.]